MSQTRFRGVVFALTYVMQLCTGLSETGTIKIDGIAKPFDYYYKVLVDNRSDRSLQSMSRNSGYKQKPCSACQYYFVFERFFEYYEFPDFADRLIQAAFDGASTSFKYGEWDFSTLDLQSRSGEYSL